MRKYIALVLTLVCVLALVGCEKNDTYKIRITIPAGSTEAFVYSDEEISATGKKIASRYIIKLGVLLCFGSLLTSITVSDIFITVTVIRRQVLCGTMRKVVRSQR